MGNFMDVSKFYVESREWKKYLKLMERRPEDFTASELLNIVTKSETVNKYVSETGKKLGVLYESKYNILVVDLILGETGDLFPYERLLPAEKRGAVVALTIYKDQFVLLKQYRHAPRKFQYAFPRGFGEPEITSEENVKKELLEEIGAVQVEETYLGKVLPYSGILANQVDVFMCKVSNVEVKSFYEGIQDVVLLNEAELEEWILKKKIEDGFTLAAYSLYKVNKAIGRNGV